MPQDDLDLILPDFGNTTLNIGFASVPKIFLRFAKYLTHNGLRLSDSEMYLISLVLTLRGDSGYELRMSNLPLQMKLSTREDAKRKFREMGLIFTARVYYAGVNPPRMKAQAWDLRSLFFNLERVANLWLENQRALVKQWKAAGSKGSKPVYEFPADFALEVELPPDVARDLLAPKQPFYPEPTEWIEAARTISRTVPFTDGTQSPQQLALPTVRFTEGTQVELPENPEKTARTVPFTDGTHSPTVRFTDGHLCLNLLEEEDEEERATQFGEVWSLFAQHKGMSNYQPTEKEVSHLTKLFADGYTLQDIRQAMAEGFTRKNPPNNFALVARIARDNRPNAARKPESKPEDVTAPPETAPEVVVPEPEPEPHAPETPEIPAELRQHADLLTNSGYAVTAGTLSSLTDLLRLYPPDVLHAALREAVLHQANNPLAYARKTLQDWAANGRPNPPTAPAAVIVDADLAQLAHILGLAGIDLTERIHAQLRLLADDCQAAAEQAGESGAIWLAAALTQSLNKHNPLDYAAAILANWQKNGRPQPKAAPAQPQTPGTPRNGRTHLTKSQQGLQAAREAFSALGL